MRKKYVFDFKVFATKVAISFLFVSIFVVIVYFCFNKSISKYVSLINTFTIKESSLEKKVLFDDLKKELKTYPAYGSKYANIKIESVGINLPVYYGDTMEILSYGIGQYAGSYFPGEGGSIVLAGHNDPGYFDNLLKVKKDDKVELDTSYGKFNYVVDSFKVVNENDLDSFPIQTEKEMLIMYTCYPLGVGRKTERFVVYAYKAGDKNE